MSLQHTSSSMGLAGKLALLIACAVSIGSFWSIGTRAEDVLFITGYSVTIHPGEKKTFGYGGEAPGETVDVLFQGPEMSNVAFEMSRSEQGDLAISGKDDEIFLRRASAQEHVDRKNPFLHLEGEPVFLKPGDSFMTEGVLGRSAFTLLKASQLDDFELELRHPVGWPVAASPTRIVTGVHTETVFAPLDEIHIRMGNGNKVQYRAHAESCGLKLVPEINYGSTVSGQASCVAQFGTTNLGNLRLTFRNFAHPTGLWPLSRWNSVQWFGVKFATCLLLLAGLFSLNVQQTWAQGATVFGCLALIATFGTVLTAKDFFLSPYAERFPIYLKSLYWVCMAVFVVRVPYLRGGGLFSPVRLVPLGTAWIGFGVLAALLNDSSWGGSGHLWMAALVAFPIGLIIGLVTFASLSHLSMARFGQHWSSYRLRVVCLAIVAFLSMLFLLSVAMGGREALRVPGIPFRIHLPTIIVPCIAILVPFLIWITQRKQNNNWQNAIVVAFSFFLIIGIYRLLSGDNGGMAVMSFALLSSVYVSLENKRLAAIIILVVAATAGIVAHQTRNTRFELAWGSQEQQLLHYDESVNLRTGRDLARAGGLRGLGAELIIPKTIRSNIHNDLVATYLTGYFGWVALISVIISYLAIYMACFSALRQCELIVQDGNGNSEEPRWIIVQGATALLLTSALQNCWVLCASLNRYIPLTGIDLTPLSGSVISVISFFMMLVFVVGSQQLAVSEEKEGEGYVMATATA